MNYINKNKVNLPPGTLHYTGHYADEELAIEVLQYNRNEFKRFRISDITELEANESDVRWVNISGLNHMDFLTQLGEHFNIDRMNLEDIIDVYQRSKLEKRDHYLFSIFKMFYLKQTDIISEHVSVILLKNMLITFQETSDDIFESIRERLEANEGQIRRKNVDYLYYSLLDNLIDQYFISLHLIEQRFTQAEMKIVEQKSRKMDEIYQLRKDLLYLKNGIDPVKNILQTIIKDSDTYFSNEVKQYFNDILDNTLHIVESIMTFREMVDGLYEAQVSNRNDEMNKTIMTLTIFSVIFAPLSFLTGVFGMNFIHMPLLSYKYAFIAFVAFCLLIVSAMIVFFIRKKMF